MKPVFIRHNLDPSSGILKDLWSRRLIAIHYDNIPSIKPDEYQQMEGRAALKRLLGYCKSGAVVGATYRSIRPDKIIIGEIAEDSKVEILNYTNNSGKSEHLKVVQLINAQEISFLDYPLLAAIQPIQKTLTGWPSAEKYLLAILRGQSIDWGVGSLAPSQLEVICYEFLRGNSILKMLLLPIGRSLPDIDIYGLDEEGNKILAQVTYSRSISEIERKLAQLKEYQRNDVRLIFFGRERFKREDALIQYISVEQVFDHLSSNTDYRRLIATMLLQ